ncbi:MAG TPA: tRNA-uridine aminocarboxypropyltransferase [Polaromonas sp.]|uniref:tRNA-uridine aminocarboxypropyltransferase n=1 Tax=Polaromonas sp. TaxID=1869339 RepID=UPI002D35DDA6|nr:tRNA-uridine aminocarboxypropyltransferase [Polaromonas sp.]HYW56674.1 tRNA-uridine aminocarboxypropyltransferase [Polaromonas sp.]
MTARQHHPVQAAGGRRQQCAGCQRPQNACICTWVTPVAHQVEVLILQHPLEVNNPKGTARLLHLCLPHSRLLTGEVFDAAVLCASESRHTLLLYPDMPQDRALGIAAPPALPPDALRDAACLRLVVLDGTWRKSRKMLHLNPALQQLPRLSLQGLPVSRYRIRQTHQPDQLSTLEATCAALIQIEGNAEKFQVLMTAFDGFVRQQMGYLASH